jgi:arabinosaccharide transport system substrate-binding protein
MGFHLGKPILVMLVVALVTGVSILLARNADPRADIELWCFANSHYRTFTGEGKPPGQAPLDVVARETGRTVEARLIQHRAMNVRLATLILSDVRGPEVPDAVEIEIGSVGQFFRPPVNDVGLLPLDSFVDRYGWRDKIVPARLAPWTKQGVLFGIPHDVHPCTLAYRADLFAEAGVDLEASETWEQFIENCRKYQRYWRERGVARRWAIEWPESEASRLVTLLLQRGINLVDENGVTQLENPKVLDTLLMYVRLAAGEGRIGAPTSSGEQVYSQDFASGYVGVLLTPDWRLKYLKDYAPDLKGKVRVMRLPAFPDSPYRTSTWGGTMIGIPRNARDPELSWKLIEVLYLRPEGTSDTMRNTYILPPVRTLWNDPIHDEADPFYSGQKVRALNVELANAIPPRVVSPASTVADASLSLVLIRAIAYMRDHGEDGLEEACRRWLHDANKDLKRRIAHGSFD